jgi:hypothetical protein
MPEPFPTHVPSNMTEPRPSAFLALLPAVRRAARFRFRFVRCPDRRADLTAETVALAWAWFVRLAERGRDPAAFPTAFAALAARAVAGGRRLAGQETTRDVLSWSCRRRNGFAVVALQTGLRTASPLIEAVTDNTRSPVPVQAQFRCDVPNWLLALKPRDRRIAIRLALGYRTSDVAARFGLTAARVSQLRGELRHSFLRFLAGPVNR